LQNRINFFLNRIIRGLELQIQMISRENTLLKQRLAIQEFDERASREKIARINQEVLNMQATIEEKIRAQNHETSLKSLDCFHVPVSAANSGQALITASELRVDLERPSSFILEMGDTVVEDVVSPVVAKSWWRNVWSNFSSKFVFLKR
jgi:hypothetical protein